MIVCRECGDRSADGSDFCGSCGSFLEFSGERVAEPATAGPAATAPTGPAPPPPARPAEPPPGLLHRVRTAVRGEQQPADAAESEPAVAVTGTVVPRPGGKDRDAAAVATSATAAPVLPVATPAGAPTPTASPAAPPPPPPPTPAAEVTSGVESPPTPSSGPVAVQPVAMQPAVSRPRPAPQLAAAPQAVARTDDVECAQCGARSPRDRRFCTRCGASLVAVIEAPPPPPPPWWRRILSRRRRPPEEVGDEPKTKRGSSARRRLAAVWQRRPEMLAVIGVIVVVIGLIPALRNPIVHGVSALATDARRAIAPSFVQVLTTGGKASTSLPGHPGSLAADTGKNTYWAAPAPAPGVPPPVLTVTFDHAVDVDKVGFTVGGPNDLGIPQSVHLVFSDGSVTDAQLVDTRDFQIVDVDAHKAAGVQISIVSVWQQRASAFALAEVEFWERR